MTDMYKTFASKLEETIRRTGRTIIGTWGGEEGSETAFAYTIGHADRDLPELIVTGMNGDSAQYLLNNVGDMLFAQADRQVGDTADRGAMPREYDLGHIKVRIVDAPSAPGTHALQALYRAERKGVALKGCKQIVWPDREGNFPGDASYDAARFPQPIIH